MKLSHLLPTLAGAAVALGLTLAVTAQEPPPSPPTAPPDAAAPAQPEQGGDGELRRLDTIEEQVDAVDQGAAVEADDAANAADAAAAEASDDAQEAHQHHGRAGEVVRFLSDALLPKDQKAQTVVGIFANVIADGEVYGETVAIMGNNTTNGSAREVIAVFGDVTVNGHVHGQVVAVMGNVQLGPNAVVDGELVCVGGAIDRAPGSRVNGPINQVGPFPLVTDGLQGLRTWFKTCLLLGRPLAFHRDVLWAWAIAMAFIGVYLFIALVFNRAVIASAATLETRPGYTILIAVVAALLGPLIVIVLSTIGVGLLLIPILFLAGLFGKTAFLAWLGRRMTLPLGVSHSFVAVLCGAVILLLVYTIPFLGFLFMKVSSGLGLGMALYAGFLATRPKPAPAGLSVPPVPPPAYPVAASGVVASGAAPSTPSTTLPPPIGSPGPSAASFSAGPTPVTPPAPSYSAAPPLVAPEAVQWSTLPRAGFWIRVAAAALDVVLVSIVLAMIDIGEYLPLMLAVYCVVLWTLRGTTIGGIICGLKVVRLDDRKVDWSVSIVRALGAFLSLAVLGLGFIWVAFDPERQSWHDKIAGTTIVRTPKGLTLV